MSIAVVASGPAGVVSSPAAVASGPAAVAFGPAGDVWFPTPDCLIPGPPSPLTTRQTGVCGYPSPDPCPLTRQENYAVSWADYVPNSSKLGLDGQVHPFAKEVLGNFPKLPEFVRQGGPLYPVDWEKINARLAAQEEEDKKHPRFVIPIGPSKDVLDAFAGETLPSTGCDAPKAGAGGAKRDRSPQRPSSIFTPSHEVVEKVSGEPLTPDPRNSMPGAPLKKVKTGDKHAVTPVPIPPFVTDSHGSGSHETDSHGSATTVALSPRPDEASETWSPSLVTVWDSESCPQTPPQDSPRVVVCPGAPGRAVPSSSNLEGSYRDSTSRRLSFDDDASAGAAAVLSHIGQTASV
jgi:hypothetical protein